MNFLCTHPYNPNQDREHFQDLITFPYAPLSQYAAPLSITILTDEDKVKFLLGFEKHKNVIIQYIPLCLASVAYYCVYAPHSCCNTKQ